MIRNQSSGNDFLPTKIDASGIGFVCNRTRKKQVFPKNGSTFIEHILEITGKWLNLEHMDKSFSQILMFVNFSEISRTSPVLSCAARFSLMTFKKGFSNQSDFVTEPFETDLKKF